MRVYDADNNLTFLRRINLRMPNVSILFGNLGLPCGFPHITHPKSIADITSVASGVNIGNRGGYYL